MDTDQSTLLWSPEIALRSKKQVLLEDWGTSDQNEAEMKRSNTHLTPVPAFETWTTFKPTFKPHGLTVFYHAHSSPPIPSTAEIYDANEKDSIRGKLGNHAVCRLGDAVVKYSCDPNVLSEAEDLLFLAEKRPELRIPTVFAAWSTTRENEDATYYFMMNFIKGIALSDEKFAELSIYAQDTICSKVSSQLRYLRDLPSEGYYGRPYHQGWLNPPVHLETNSSGSIAVTGPYKTYEEFCAAIYRARQMNRAVGTQGLEWRPKEVENTTELVSIFSGWTHNEPRLTWLDPQIRNIVARQVIANDGSEDWEVFLIDWECFGWYPAWLQGLQVRRRSGIVLVQGTDFTLHRESEIRPMMLKDFDPEPDEERMAGLSKHYWEFY